MTKSSCARLAFAKWTCLIGIVAIVGLSCIRGLGIDSTVVRLLQEHQLLDKVFHLLVFGALSIPLSFLAVLLFGVRSLGAHSAWLGISVLFALVEEGAQVVLQENHFDFWDVVASILGIVIVGPIGGVIATQVRRESPPTTDDSQQEQSEEFIPTDEEGRIKAMYSIYSSRSLRTRRRVDQFENQ